MRGERLLVSCMMNNAVLYPKPQRFKDAAVFNGARTTSVVFQKLVKNKDQTKGLRRYLSSRN